MFDCIRNVIDCILQSYFCFFSNISKLTNLLLYVIWLDNSNIIDLFIILAGFFKDDMWFGATVATLGDGKALVSRRILSQ